MGVSNKGVQLEALYDLIGDGENGGSRQLWNEDVR